jgi:hypothetical protein
MIRSDGFSRFLCLSVDVEAYGRRDDPGQVSVQAELVDLLDRAGSAAGLDRRRWIRQGKGDEELSLVPTEESEVAVVDDLFRYLADLLAARNRWLPQAGRLRLRAAVAHGPVHRSGVGFAGSAVVTVSRLVGSAALKAALRQAVGSDVVVLLSDQIYRDLVLGGRTSLPAAEIRALAIREKEHEAQAWLWVPGVDANLLALEPWSVGNAAEADPRNLARPGFMEGDGNVIGDVRGNGNAVGYRNQVGR